MPSNRYAYHSTPRGFAEKSRPTTEPLTVSLDFFRYAALVNASELAEVAVLGAGPIALFGRGSNLRLGDCGPAGQFDGDASCPIPSSVPSQADCEVVRLPAGAEIYRRKVEALETALQDEAIRPEATEIPRSMMEQVVVTPTKDGTLRVELHGDIARLITADEPVRAAATKTKRAASGEAARAVLSVVAGVRNQP